MPIRALVEFDAELCRLGPHQVARPLHRLCRGARSVAAAKPPRRSAGRQRRSRRVGGRRRGRRAAAARRPRGAAEDGAGRSDVAPAGRREHAGGRARGARERPATRHRRSNRRAPTSPRLLAQCDAVDLPGRLQHHHRDLVLRRPRRPGALRHGARDRAGRSRARCWPSAAWWPSCRPARCRPRAWPTAVGAGPGRPVVAQLPALRRQWRSRHRCRC